jgi:hypothetical protein
MICILEDDPKRIEQFHAAAARVAPNVPLRIWCDAHAMLAELPEYLDRVSLISLDHDLHPSSNATNDPGCGYDIARVLGELIPCCPVIIHTSNGECGTWMEGELSRAGWNYARIAPFGEQWIETDWAPVAQQFLKDPSL